MDASYLRLLIDYHYWARHRLLEAVTELTPEQYTRDLGSSFKSVRDTLVHLYSAEWAWHQRWVGTSPTKMVTADQFPDLESLHKTWHEHEEQVRRFMDGLDDAGVHRVYEYKMISGTAASSVLWHMVTHLVNHGSYHRGQVTTMLRQLGAAPPKSMDLIAYYRESARN
jgi:uncharacterized damage-inducible protein DinB